MAELILKYLSIITVAGAAVSFVIGLIKYLDQRAREERNKRYQLFHNLIREISGRNVTDSTTIALTQQLAAIYELKHFKEYAYAAVPILEYLRADTPGGEQNKVFLAAIDYTINELNRFRL
jgi:hypothetical protein